MHTVAAIHEGLTVLKMIPLPSIGHDPEPVSSASHAHILSRELFIIMCCPHILVNFLIALLQEASGQHSVCIVCLRYSSHIPSIVNLRFTF
jgi:hypothetical protein